MCYLLGHVWFFATPWTVASQAPLSMGFPRQEYWSIPFLSPWDLPNSGIEPGSPALREDSSPPEPWQKPHKNLENIMKVWIKGLQRRVEGVLTPDSRIKINRVEKAWMTFHGWWRQITKVNRPFLWWEMFEVCLRDICWYSVSLNIFNNHQEKVAHWNEAIHSDIVTHTDTHTCAHTSVWRFHTSQGGDS